MCFPKPTNTSRDGPPQAAARQVHDREVRGREEGEVRRQREARGEVVQGNVHSVLKHGAEKGRIQCPSKAVAVENQMLHSAPICGDGVSHALMGEKKHGIQHCHVARKERSPKRTRLC